MIQGSIERAAAYGIDTPFQGNNTNRLKHSTDYDGETRRIELTHSITGRKGIYLGKHDKYFVICTKTDENGIDGCEMYENLAEVQRYWKLI